MVKTKRVLSLMLCIIMAISAFCCVNITASAATSGGSKAGTITVVTKANYLYPGSSSITLKQSKQTLTYKSLVSNKTKTKTGYYGYYNISVYNATKGKTKSICWGGGQTKKISLDPNCTYKITVRYNSTATVTFTKAPFGYSWKSSSSPYWIVKSTWKVSSYY